MYDVVVYGKDVGDLPGCARSKVEALENETSVDTLRFTVVFESLSDTVGVRPNDKLFA